jgi:transcriptional regulator with XRE-family HTH domain
MRIAKPPNPAVDQIYTDVGKRIRDARGRAGLSQEDLAAAVALKRTSITNIESGRQKLLLHTFVDVAAALGVSPAALLPELTPAGDAQQEFNSVLEHEQVRLDALTAAEEDWIRAVAITPQRAPDGPDSDVRRPARYP